MFEGSWLDTENCKKIIRINRPDLRAACSLYYEKLDAAVNQNINLFSKK